MKVGQEVWWVETSYTNGNPLRVRLSARRGWVISHDTDTICLMDSAGNVLFPPNVGVFLNNTDALDYRDRKEALLTGEGKQVTTWAEVGYAI